jgi:hypothetical protein
VVVSDLAQTGMAAPPYREQTPSLDRETKWGVSSTTMRKTKNKRTIQ